MATIRLPLGISREGNPSLKTLRKRARDRAEMVSANQSDLAFLCQSDFPELMPLLVVDNLYVLEGEIPEAQNEPLFNLDGRANIRRGDQKEEELINNVLDALTASSQLLDRVANVMSTATRVRDEIRQIERETGADTKWARRFVYQKQAEFDVTVDDEAVTFNSHAVRTTAPIGDDVKLLFTQPTPKPEGMQLVGEVNATMGDNLKVGVQKGGAHSFRFGLLEPWQSAVLECSKHFQLQILATVTEAETTCGLRETPVGVQQVHNWPDLVSQVLTELSKAAHLLIEQAKTQNVDANR